MKIPTLFTWLFTGLMTSGLMTSGPPAYAAEALVAVNDHEFEVGLAVTPAERELGLMYRTVLGADQGMLFVYPAPKRVSFWMKQTLIPLDILFFSEDGRLVQSYEDVQPCSMDPCRNYASVTAAQYVLEVPAGTMKRLSLKLGNRLEILKR